MSRRLTQIDGGRAVLAARDADTEPDTTELARLAAAAGYDPVASVTQRRREDPGTWLGRGKAATLAERAAETDADAVLVDGGLTPGQHANLLELLPTGTELVDRYRLVLGIFADGSADRRAALQVEAATLRYELPRLRRVTEESLLNEATEKGSPVLDAERRIDRIETKLAALSDEAAERRAERRAAGLGLVALAGYTNAGKTTLLHRLADGLSVDTDEQPGHADETDSTPVADELFVTLETTTRRGEVAGRPAVFTDTVGLLDGVPHDLVESFGTTLSAVAGADVPVLVVDASDPVERVREKVRVSLAALEADAPLVALNKADAVEADGLTARREAVADLLCEGGETVPVSAHTGAGIDRLREAVAERLPTERATFRLPNAPETESFLAWARERGACEISYEGSEVAVAFVSRPEVVAEARGRVPAAAESG